METLQELPPVLPLWEEPDGEEMDLQADNQTVERGEEEQGKSKSKAFMKKNQVD